jgi:ribonuclease HI
VWDADAIERLAADHPNAALVRYVVDLLRNGADLHVRPADKAAFADAWHVVGHDPAPPPGPGVGEYRDAVAAKIAKHVAAGTMLPLGPGEPVILHEIFAIEDGVNAAGTTKTRLIHNLTGNGAPNCLNTHIDTSLWGGQVGAKLMKEAVLEAEGEWAVATISDVTDAFRTLFVRAEQQRLQAFYFEGRCYTNLVLTFGCAAAGFIWGCLAAVMHWVINDQIARSLRRGLFLVKHTGDDYKGLVRLASHAMLVRDVMRDTFALVKAPIGEAKNQCAAATVYGGIGTDLSVGTVFIKDDRRVHYLADLVSVTANPDRIYSAKELLSIVGKMSYVAPQVGGLAAVLTVRMRDLAYSVPVCKQARRCLSLTQDVLEDVAVTTEALRLSCPRLFRAVKVAGVETDASGIWGLGAVLFMEELPEVPFITLRVPPAFLLSSSVVPELSNRLAGDQQSSSALLELLAVVVSLSAFAPKLRSCTVVVTTDSAATVSAIQKSTSHLARSAQLVKCLAAISIRHDITLRAVHRTRDKMAHVDALTHGDVAMFRALVPRAAAQPTVVPFDVFCFLLNPWVVPSTADIFKFF